MKSIYRVIILSFLGVIWLFAVLQLDQLKFQLDFEQYFPKNDLELDVFNEFKKQYGADDNFYLIAFERKEGVFDSTFLIQYSQFSEESEDLPFVLSSQSLTSIRYPVKTPLMLRYESFLNANRPEMYDKAKSRIFSNDQLTGNFISRDSTALVVSMQIKEGIRSEESDELISKTKAVIAKYPALAEYHILGKPFIQISIIQMQKRELTVSLGICSVLMVLIMWFLYKKIWPIVITSVGIGLSIAIFLGILAIWGRGGDELIALYPVVIIIVGISDIIHILSKYVEELRLGKERWLALKVTFKEIGMATLITSLTTAAGFVSLWVTDVEMVKIFGINSAIGVMVTYILLMLYLLAVLPFFDLSHFYTPKMAVSDFWPKLLTKIYLTGKGKSRKVVVYTLLLSLFSVFGISIIGTNHKFVFNLPKRSAVTNDFIFFEEKLNGFRPLEVIVISKDSLKVTDFEFVTKIEKIESYLCQNEAIHIGNSIPAIYKSIGQNIRGAGHPEDYQFPNTTGSFQGIARFANLKIKKDQLTNEAGNQTRISLTIKDIGADNIQFILNDFKHWVATEFSEAELTCQVTGTGLLIDKNVEYVRRSIMKGLGLAIVVVALLLGLIFRNAMMVFVGILPNIFPILFTAAIVGYIGLELEISVGIVFVITFGIAVDDTIHFLTKYKLLRKNLTVDDALQKTILETGKAIILTSVILFFAFFSLVFSVFPPSTVIGILVSLTLFSAVVSNMYLLPVIIRLVDND